MRRTLLIALPPIVLAGLIPSAIAISSVQAVGGTGVYGGWSLNAGSSNSGVLNLGSNVNGFLVPAASWSSSASSVTFPTGASTWLGPTTPFGSYFGSSQNRAYMNQGTAPSAQPSVITYTFSTVTPSGTWGFALGDIDADKVKISAEDPLGNAVDVSGWYESSFNYCNVSPKPSGCPAGSNTDTPVWDPATATLVGNGADTSGAAAWFMPTASIKTLTFTFTRLTGIPVYQTWIAVDEASGPSPSPTPTSESPTPSPTSSSASPSPTSSPEPTPTPTPTPAPEPQKPTEPVELPQTIDNPGTTTIIDEPIVTNGGQTVTVTVTCVPLVYGRGAAVPRGSYELCTVRKYRKSGVVTVTTYGNPLQLTVTLKAPAIEGYTAYKRTKVYAVR